MRLPFELGGQGSLTQVFLLTHIPENNRWNLSLPSSNSFHSLSASRNGACQIPMSCWQGGEHHTLTARHGARKALDLGSGSKEDGEYTGPNTYTEGNHF